MLTQLGMWYLFSSVIYWVHRSLGIYFSFNNKAEKGERIDRSLAGQGVSTYLWLKLFSKTGVGHRGGEFYGTYILFV